MPPSTFAWEGIGYDKFKVEFSSLALPPGDDSWLLQTSLVPTEEDWEAIRTIGQSNGTVYWSVEGVRSDGSVSYSETWRFTIQEDVDTGTDTPTDPTPGDTDTGEDVDTGKDTPTDPAPGDTDTGEDVDTGKDTPTDPTPGDTVTSEDRETGTDTSTGPTPEDTSTSEDGDTAMATTTGGSGSSGGGDSGPCFIGTAAH
jgi:hypothetical protein